MAVSRSWHSCPPDGRRPIPLDRLLREIEGGRCSEMAGLGTAAKRHCFVSGWLRLFTAGGG